MKIELKNGIAIGVSVILILIIVYFMTAVLFTGEIGNKKDNETTTKVSAANTQLYDNMILAGQTFNRKEEKYMVAFFSHSKASDELKSAISNYNSSISGIKLYVVNLDEAVNRYIVSDTFNGNAQTASELKITDQAIITISNGKMQSYMILEKDIISVLK